MTADAINKFVELAYQECLLHLSCDYAGLSDVSGDAEICLRRLEYLQRTYPSSREITLGIGICRLLMDDPRASEAFEFLCVSTDTPIARFFLLLTRLRFSSFDLAFSDLGSFLRTSAIVFEEIAFDIFSLISEANRCSGWCGMLADGRMVFGRPADAVNEVIFSHTDGHFVAKTKDIGIFSGYKICEVEDFFLSPSISTMHIFSKNKMLVGSGVSGKKIWQFEGFVECSERGLTGWCRYPNNILSSYVINVSSSKSGKLLLRKELLPQQRSIFIAEKPRTDLMIYWAELQGKDTPEVSVTDGFGNEFYGSPIDGLGGGRYAKNQAEWVAAKFPSGCPSLFKPHSIPPFPILHSPKFDRVAQCVVSEKFSYRVAIIVPVYKGYEVTKECLSLVMRWRRATERLIIVNDCSPDPRIVKFLKSIENNEGVFLINNKKNRGFTYSANQGLRQVDHDEDAVLLNSDTIPCHNWVSKLQETVYREPDIGTATPLSNAATIFSYPRKDGNNPIPSYEEVAELSDVFEAINSQEIIDVPTGHGFCMYIRAQCLHQTGVLREDIFAQGYGEENDFCRRAIVLGWRHVVCLGTFVGHAEGQSFSAFKGDLIRRNLALLNSLHPGYDKAVLEWQIRDPLKKFRLLADISRLSMVVGKRKTVALVTHNREGGVQRFVQERAASILKTGKIPLIIAPRSLSGENDSSYWEVLPQLSDDYANIYFSKDGEDLRCFLLKMNCEKIEIHSYIGSGIKYTHRLSMFCIDYEVYIHDYSWICPRITLMSYNDLYCGEPSLTTCKRCIADLGASNNDDTDIQTIRAISDDLFRRAKKVIAPCRDVVGRFKRYFDTKIVIGQWELPINEQPLRFLHKRAQDYRRILIVGAISLEKGYRVLLELARYSAENDLPLRFCIVGFTCDDKKLLETGVVEITGRYAEEEVSTLIQRQSCDWGFLPAVWPETWSYVLSELWKQNLPVIAFDIGAPAERIRSSKSGLVIPLHLPVSSIVNILINPQLYSQNE